MSASRENYDVVVVGGGIGGSFAAAEAAARGVDVAQLERKSAEDGGYIACGDAIKSPYDPGKYPGEGIHMEEIGENEDVGIEGNIENIEWWDDEIGVSKKIPYDGSSNVVDRYEFGQELLDQASRRGVDQYFDTVINDVNYDNGVEAIKGIQKGETVVFDCDVLIDAGGALSDISYNEISFGEGTYFEDVNIDQFGSAYREIIETEEPVDFANSIVGMPIQDRFGYAWLFPRSDTEINVGLGVQNKEDIPSWTRRIRKILNRCDFEPLTVKGNHKGKKNKLGAELALARPLDSAVADNFIAVGGASRMTHPISGKGIRGAALSGYSAGKVAAEAVADEDVNEAGLWDHNHWLFSEHGYASKIAGKDPYSVAAGAGDFNGLRGIVSIFPEKEIQEIVGTESEVSGLDKLSVVGGAARNYVGSTLDGTFDDLDISHRELGEAMREFWNVRRLSKEFEDKYYNYPDNRGEFEEWKKERDLLDKRLLEEVGEGASWKNYNSYRDW